MSGTAAWSIDPSSAALVTVDLQRGFLDEGSPVACSAGRAFLPRLNRLMETCRIIGVPIVHVYQEVKSDFELGLLKEIRPRSHPTLECTSGLPGVELHPSLDVHDTDYSVRKIRYSPLIQGSSALEPLLHRLACSQILLCGVATDVCVSATAIDAMMLGYRVFLLSDLTATLNDQRQTVALQVLDSHFARVLDANQAEKEMSSLTIMNRPNPRSDGENGTRA